MEDLTEQLETYFRNSKTEFSFGVQNFQGIREYTKIPLAPLTLVLKISRSHPVYQLIDNFFADVDKLLKNFMGEDSSDADFLVFSNIDTNSDLEWKKPISWLEYDNSDTRPTPEMLELRTFLWPY